MLKIGIREFALILITLLCACSSSPPKVDHPAPLTYPANWKVTYRTEPVFNSKILTVEAGVEHATKLILVHGLGQNGHRDWLTTMTALQDRYHVITLDLPGFGLSEKPQGRYSPENYAKVIDGVRREMGLEKVVLVGHSMGGAVALTYAADFPESIEKLIVLNVAGVLERTAFTKHLAALPSGRGLFPGFMQRWVQSLKNFANRLVEMVSMGPNPLHFLQENNHVWNSTLSGSPNTNAALSLIQTDFSKVLDRVDTDTYIIWGAEDGIAPLRVGKLLHGQIHNSLLHVIDGAEHVPMFTHKDQVVSQLVDALESVDPFERKMSMALEKQSASHIHGKANDLVCVKEFGKTYRGAYKTITLNQCKKITLENVSAEKIVLNHAVVEMNNVQLISESTALEINSSTVEATNCRFEGELAVTLDHSRIDFAGVSAVGKKSPLQVFGMSRLIFSVSDLDKNGVKRDMHTAFKAEYSIF